MKPDLTNIITLYDEIDKLLELKRKGGEALVAEHFSVGQRISVKKYSVSQSKNVRVTGTISYLGTGSDWHYARILLDPEFRSVVRHGKWCSAPENEVWIGIADPDEEIEIL